MAVRRPIEVINDEATGLGGVSFWRKVVARNASGVVAVVGPRAREAMPDEYKQLLLHDDVPGVEEIVFELTNFTDVSAFQRLFGRRAFDISRCCGRRNRRQS